MVVGKYLTKVRKNLQKENSFSFRYRHKKKVVSEPYGIRNQGSVVATIADHITDDGRADVGFA